MVARNLVASQISADDLYSEVSIGRCGRRLVRHSGSPCFGGTGTIPGKSPHPCTVSMSCRSDRASRSASNHIRPKRGRTTAEGETALCHRPCRPVADGPRWVVGEVEIAGQGDGSVIHYRHDDAERALRRPPQPDAGDSVARYVVGMARRRRPSSSRRTPPRWCCCASRSCWRCRYGFPGRRCCRSWRNNGAQDWA